MHEEGFADAESLIDTPNIDLKHRSDPSAIFSPPTKKSNPFGTQGRTNFRNMS